MSFLSNHDAAVPRETIHNDFHTEKNLLSNKNECRRVDRTFTTRELGIEFEKLKLEVSEARVVADDQHQLASHFGKELHKEKKIAEVLKTAIVDLQCYTKKLIADINHVRSREKGPAEARAQNSLHKAAKLRTNILATYHELNEHMSNLSKCSTVALKETVARDLKAERNPLNNNDSTDRALTFREMEIEFGMLKLELAETKGTIEERRQFVPHLKKELYIERKITAELKSVFNNLQYNIKKLMVTMNRLLREKESEERTEMTENDKKVFEYKEKESNKVMEEQKDFKDRSNQPTLNMSKHLKRFSQKGTPNGKGSYLKHANMDYFIDGLKSSSQNKANVSQLGAKKSTLRFGDTKKPMDEHSLPRENKANIFGCGESYLQQIMKAT